MIAYNDGLATLDQSYDGCPTSCTRPEADMRRGCPECAVTLAYNDLRDDVERERAVLAEKRGYAREGHGREYSWPWSLDKIIRGVNFVGAAEARYGETGADVRWTVPLRTLVTIYREERRNLRRANAPPPGVTPSGWRR